MKKGIIDKNASASVEDNIEQLDDKKMMQLKRIASGEIQNSKKQKNNEVAEHRYKHWTIKTIQTGMQDPNMGLYVHIPFCSKKCDYCDFVSYSMDEEAQHKYLEALKKEIEILAPKFAYNEFNTLYIGGGTPSFVFDGFIKELANKVFSSFHFVPGFEFSIEVNPASVTEKKLFEYLQAGVNRVSIGVQCVDEKLLRELGRIQSMENVDKAFRLLHKMKFTNIGADIMLGLPHQTMGSVKSTIKYILKQNCTHVSVYTLQVEKHTRLFEQVQAGKLKPLDEETSVKMYNWVYKKLKRSGFIRYEISNFAKPTFQSLHNFKYWNDVDYIGLGVSAHSYYNNFRYNNTKRLDTYIDALSKGNLPLAEKEFLTTEDKRTECIMLSLRMATGLDLEKFKNDFKEDLLRTKADVINNFIRQKMITIENGFLKITDEYFYVSNSIILELI